MQSKIKYFKADEYNINSNELTNKIRNYIYSNDCPYFELDLTGLNLIDACKAGSLGSMYHFKKYNNGKMNIYVQDEVTKKMLSPILLQNSKITVVDEKMSNVVQLSKKFSTSLVK